jgi:hypothetical protein
MFMVKEDRSCPTESEDAEVVPSWPNDVGTLTTEPCASPGGSADVGPAAIVDDWMRREVLLPLATRPSHLPLENARKKPQKPG